MVVIAGVSFRFVSLIPRAGVSRARRGGGDGEGRAFRTGRPILSAGVAGGPFLINSPDTGWTDAVPCRSVSFRFVSFHAVPRRAVPFGLVSDRGPKVDLTPRPQRALAISLSENDPIFAAPRGTAAHGIRH